jgi:hypothetical protein
MAPDNIFNICAKLPRWQSLQDPNLDTFAWEILFQEGPSRISGLQCRDALQVSSFPAPNDVQAPQVMESGFRRRFESASSSLTSVFPYRLLKAWAELQSHNPFGLLLIEAI